MAQTAGYGQHPPHFASYTYRTPPRPTHTTGSQAYYSPRYYPNSAPPQTNHARRATSDGYVYVDSRTYTTPQKTYYYASPQYVSPDYYASAQSTPRRKDDYVSASHHNRKGTQHVRVAVNIDEKPRRSKSSSKKHHASQAQYYYNDSPKGSYEWLPRYEQYETRPPAYNPNQYYYYDARADHGYGNQVRVDTTTEKKPSTRRASHNVKQARQAPPPRRKSAPAAKPPPKATAEDARAAGIPAGFCYKNWDPTEEPIVLLGSVFDANSLGRWIYDWTVYTFGPATPMSEVAGDLWLLLIQIAGKVKRAEDCISRIRRRDSRDLVDDFLDAGERLWDKFKRLLKLCEGYMWDAAKREKKSSKTNDGVKMGFNSGCEFVDSIFGRDRELAKTEALMASMRLWSMRFDANCEEILRNPSRA